MEKQSIVLTGIKPTGEPHIGNAVGAIFPAIEKVKEIDGRSYFFLADLHALNQLKDPELLKTYTRSVIASWLTCGIDTLSNSFFYRQSDIPYVSEMMVLLTGITPKSEMNYAHAYKAMTQENVSKGISPESNVNMGLYNYPILMAADILIMDTNVVPVGSDQIQHIEIAKVIAKKFNSIYGNVLTVPEYSVLEEVANIPGIDGRKMSKSYNNQIPMFASKEQWESVIKKIPTDSTPLGEGIKCVEDTILYKIYSSIGSNDESLEFKRLLESGDMGWRDAKVSLLDLLEKRFGSLRDKYEYWLHADKEVNEILEKGKEAVLPMAMQKVSSLKEIMGISQRV